MLHERWGTMHVLHGMRDEKRCMMKQHMHEIVPGLIQMHNIRDYTYYGTINDERKIVAHFLLVQLTPVQGRKDCQEVSRTSQ
jgi:hypothetical protein